MIERTSSAGLTRLLRPRHIAAYAEAHAARLEELDFNMLLVLPQGQGAVAVDALLRVREEREE